jgi:hypothetical protein
VPYTTQIPLLYLSCPISEASALVQPGFHSLELPPSAEEVAAFPGLPPFPLFNLHGRTALHTCLIASNLRQVPGMWPNRFLRPTSRADFSGLGLACLCYISITQTN